MGAGLAGAGAGLVGVLTGSAWARVRRTEVDLASAAAGFFFTSSLVFGAAAVAAGLGGNLATDFAAGTGSAGVGLAAGFLTGLAVLADLAGFPLLDIVQKPVGVNRIKEAVGSVREAAG